MEHMNEMLRAPIKYINSKYIIDFTEIKHKDTQKITIELINI